MRLAISRRAAPEMSLARLLALAHDRGLDGVEISEADLDDAPALEQLAGAVVGVHVESRAAAVRRRTARLAARLGAPVVAARGALGDASLADLDALYREEGAQLLLSHGTDVAEAAALVEAIAAASASAIALAWDVDPKRDDRRDAPAVLLATTGALRCIRMRGGGPELADDDGAGTGDFVASVALSGFAGVVTLIPTSDERADEWRGWLAGALKSGCGSARAKRRSNGRDVDLDIRRVEPKNRMETILGSYRALAPGRTLHVTFDHDPSCMFYTLQATEPEGSFVFQRKDDGPEVWRADVTKRAH